jgi:DNA repair protein RadA
LKVKNKDTENSIKLVKKDNEINSALNNYSDILISENQQPEKELFILASEIDSKIERLSTGAKSLDDMIGGGLELKTITQFYGSPGSGKTQLCFTLCAILPSHFKCIYLDTEGTFRPERIKQIATARNTNTTIQNIFVAKVSTTFELEKCIDSIDKKIRLDSTIKLIIIDSMTNLFRVEYSGPTKLSQRQQQLNKYMYKLHHLAQTQNVAIVMTNQVYSDYSASYQKDKPVGGYIINYTCTNIINLVKSGHRVIVQLIKSPCYPYDITYLEIYEHGVSDTEETIK